MPAQRQISAKLLGGRKGQPASRARSTNEINPNELGMITLNRDAIQALTLAQARVQVSISAGGTTVILVSEDTGKQVGGIDDLTKLLGLRSFVTKEKKMSASSELQQEIITVAARASAKIKEADPNFVQKKLDNSFIVAARPYKAQADAINDRITQLRDNHHEGTPEVKLLLQWYCNQIDAALALTLEHMVKGEKEKGYFDQLLFDMGVPAYVKNKLLTKSLVINRDTDLDRVLFPQDPSKGLALTPKEWRDEAFVKKQGWVMRNSAFVINVLQDEELFLELTGLSKEQLDTGEDPKVQRVLTKTRIHVIPPYEDHKRVLEPLSRPNFRGFGLPNTAMDQQRDRLANLCAVPMRAYAFSVRMAETRSDFFDRIFPTGTIRAVDEKLGNYAKQSMDALDRGTKCSLLPIIRLESDHKSLLAWVNRECKIIPNGALEKQIRGAIFLNEGEGTGDTYDVPVTEPKWDPVPVDMISALSTGTEKDMVKSLRSAAFSLKEKAASKKRTQAASVLRREARTFLKHVARDYNPMLAESMEAYFRGFYSEDIQSAAVRIAEARFDELDEVSDLGSSDESGSEADSDEE